MLIYLVIVPILLAVLSYIFPDSKIGKSIVVLSQLGLLGAAIYLFYLTTQAEITVNIGRYSEHLGIVLRADRLSAVFILLTITIFLAVSVYNIRENSNRLFWFLLLTLEGIFIGLFVSRDIFNIFVLAEVSTVIVAVLLMYNRERRSMYDGIVYLVVNVITMQFYLFGVGYLYMLMGSLDMSLGADMIRSLPYEQLILPYALIMTAVASKSSLLPMFTFLPKIHSMRQAPVSVAVILSCLQIKAGLYLFLRFRVMFAPIDGTYFFLILGVLTALFGIIMAVTQREIKSLLAYSTIAQVGLIVIGLSLDGEYAYIGSIYHIASHAISKAILFLTAGIIVKAYNTSELHRIRGVIRRMPLTAASIIVAILAMTGAPMFSGNISKYFMMEGVNFPLYPIMLLINLGTIVIFIKFGSILFGKPQGDNYYREVDYFKQATDVILGVVCLIGGIFGPQILNLMSGMSLTLDPRGYLEKLGTLVVSFVLGFLIYRFVVKNNQKLEKIGYLDLGMRHIMMSIGVFFAITLVVVGFVI